MEDKTEYQSKTQKKKEADRLQKIGETLAGLPVQQLAAMDLPQDLKTALIEARAITAKVAARRHRQYIGALMRNLAPEVLDQALAQSEAFDTQTRETDHAAAAWVDRLTAGTADDVEAFVAEFPGADRQQIRQQLRNIKKQKDGPPSSKPRQALAQIVSDCVRDG